MTKGFKVFNKDWTCNGFQYEVGGTYEMKESPICCNRGFHFCTKLSDCFNYYAFNSNNKVAEVEAIGEVVSDSGDTKHCTNKIKIINELTWHEVLDLVNMGKDCTGYCNSGDYNSGNRNSGNRNSGNRNSGDYNSGNRNSGDYNSGDYNSGDWNSGDWNSGNRNSGNWNSGNRNSGNWLNHPARFVLNGVPFDELRWVYSEDMTDDEKKEHPEHDVTGGFLKEFDYSKNRQNWWDGLDKENKEKIKSLPNFDKEKFERIVGIKID